MRTFICLVLILLSGCAGLQQRMDNVRQAREMRVQHNRYLANIFLTTGNLPPSQQYTILGEVAYSTVGSINMGSILNDSMFRSKFAVAVAGPTVKLSPQGMERQLKSIAYARYGLRLSAIIQASYSADQKSGDAYGRGVAVELVK